MMATPIAARGGAAAPHDPPALAGLLPRVRASLPDDLDLPDAALIRSLGAIAGSGTRTERWRTAFNSEMGRSLATRGTDLNTALNTILGLLPSPRR